MTFTNLIDAISIAVKQNLAPALQATVKALLEAQEEK
jgi:hypothetical protein